MHRLLTNRQNDGPGRHPIAIKCLGSQQVIMDVINRFNGRHMAVALLQVGHVSAIK